MKTFAFLALVSLSMLKPSPADAASSPTIRIVSATVSASQVRDGQRFLLNYQIYSSDVKTVMLGCTLHGPNGVTIEDDTNENPENYVTLSVGTNWYQREFFLNMPPKAPTGYYGVEFGVDWDVDGFTSFMKGNALQIIAPISVRVPILMYHKVGPVAYSENWVANDSFLAQMNVLRAYGYELVSLYDVMNCRAGVSSLPVKPIVITFDDAYENILTNAFPILNGIGAKSFTSFVPTDKVGGDNSWDVADDNPIIPLLTWDEIKQLQKAGIVDFESHTVTHPYLNMVSATQLSYEMQYSAATLKAQLGYRPLFLAYPYGMYYGREENAARAADYFGAVDSGAGIEMTCKDKWALQRVQIDWNTTVSYDSKHPSDFFLNKIGENFILPSVSVQSLQVFNGTSAQLPISANFRRGNAIVVRAQTSTAGASACVTANLRISTDSAGHNIVYDSSAVGQDVTVNLNQGLGQFLWCWGIPSTASTGTYYVSVKLQVKDTNQVIQFAQSATSWQELFIVSP